MNKEALKAFSCEAAKGFNTEQGLNESGQMLTKVTVECAVEKSKNPSQKKPTNQRTVNTKPKKASESFGKDSSGSTPSPQRQINAFTLIGNPPFFN